MIHVAYLTEQEIERDAGALLDAYHHECGLRATLPVAVEEILETFLGLSLDFDDLGARLGLPDLLGALWVDTESVVIDERLVPEDNPEMAGRFNFTLGHEVGHWRLHRHVLAAHAGQLDLFAQSTHEPAVVCRKSQAREPIEWQADYFSACLLMPRHAVAEQWSRRFGSLEPIQTGAVTGTPSRLGLHEDVAPYEFDVVARAMAPTFEVSVQAMRIRLENLGLLQRGDRIGRSLFAGD